MPETVDILIAKAQGGDSAAFRDLMDAWGPRVLAFMKSRLDSEEDALDATQELFIRVWSALGRFRLGASFPAWIFTIAANLVRNRWKSRSLDRRKTEAVGVELAAAPSGDPSEAALDELRSEELRGAVATLPADLRRVVEFYYFAGLDIRETATALGLGEEAVKSRLFRARSKLRTALEKSQPGKRS
ncbi:MAG: RNA polymerase sigma factor [Treponema sp.]|nr:RNA polymerase sigma factor [Treponema sp.]